MESALYIAAERGHDIVVEKLLEHGANIEKIKCLIYSSSPWS